MARCMGCMSEYDDRFEVCPRCGYIVYTPPKEAYHLTPGTVLHGNYIVGKVLGNGGFGVTYLGWDSVLEQKVAIKEYFPGEFSTRVPGQTEVSVFSGDRAKQFNSGMVKFIEEAQRLALFNKTKGVVHVYDYFEENSTAYIIMEYLDGESYKDKMKRQWLISPEEARDVIIAVLEALEVVHAEGIIHRDIAPDNIMLTKSGEITLLDFGASRFATTKHSKSLSVILKPGYAPEEQYRSRGDQGPWTDVYAVAATFYKMVTGITPQASIERSARDLVKRPSKLGVKIKKNLENAVMNAMNIRIDDRTKSAREFLDALNAEKVKRKREKIRAADIGRLPLWIKILAPLAMAGIGTFLALMFTGVISFFMVDPNSTSLPEGMVRVPSIVNMTYDDAEANLALSNLKIQVSKKEYSNTIAADTVLRQETQEGEIVAENTVIPVVVSAGIERFYVPSVVGKYEKDVKELLQESKIKWYKTSICSDVPPGWILAQSIEAGTEFTDGMELELIVSEGLRSVPTEGTVIIPEIKSLHYSEIRRDLQALGLYPYVFSWLDDETMPYDYIKAQAIAADSEVQAGTPFGLQVNRAHGMIKVPDNIVKTSAFGSKASLEELYFNVTIEREYSSSVEKDKVISTDPVAGTEVPVGSDIKLVVSDGEKPRTTYNYSSNNYYYGDVKRGGPSTVTVPKITGMKINDARSLLYNSYLFLSYGNYVSEYSDTVPLNTIIYQYPEAGSVVANGTEITYRYSLGPEYIPVPNYVGLQGGPASQGVNSSLLSTYVYYEDREKTVTRQDPAAGTMVRQGTYIHLYFD